MTKWIETERSDLRFEDTTVGRLKKVFGMLLIRKLIRFLKIMEYLHHPNWVNREYMFKIQ